MKNRFEFIAVIDRAKKAFKIKDDKELAEFIGMNSGSFHARKKAQSLPFEELLLAANQENIDFNWLLTGAGTMYRAASTEPHSEKVLELYGTLTELQRREILSAIEEKQQFNQLVDDFKALKQKVG